MLFTIPGLIPKNGETLFQEVFSIYPFYSSSDEAGNGKVLLSQPVLTSFQPRK
jgi:hypothetical protein